MSQRIQRSTPAVAGVEEVDFFVNIYLDENGRAYQGSKTFRQEANAVRKGLNNVGGSYVKTIKVTATVDV